MRALFEGIYDTSIYVSLVEKDRARLVYGIASLMITLLTVFGFLVYEQDGVSGNVWQHIPQEPALLVFAVFLYSSCIASIYWTRIGRIQRGSTALVTAWAVSVGVPIAQRGLYNFTAGQFLITITLLAGLLLGMRGLAFGAAITFGLIIFGISSRAVVPPPANWNNGVGDTLSGFLILTILTGIIYLFLRFSKVAQEEARAGSRSDRLKLAEITSQVSQRISRRMALSEVLSNAVEQVRDNYSDIYHAQIFLVDERENNARLAASTGEVGRKLIERHHALPVGSQSVIGQVTARGRTIVARAGSGPSVHQRNELLPDTQVEAAFPLRIGDTVIGALDLQSRLVGTFQEDDIPAFQSLADHIAIAIDNARLFEQTEKRLEENQKLVEQSRQAVREVERLNQRLTGRFWDDFLNQQDEAAGVTIGFDGNSTPSESEWTTGLKQAIQFNHPIQQEEADRRVVALPLRVRGQVIGAMEFELDTAGNISPEDMILIEEVGEQLGLAAESNRLFQSSQRLAQREALVSEIAARLQASNNVEMTLNEAARSLKEVLKVDKVAIRLGPPPANGAAKGGRG